MNLALCDRSFVLAIGSGDNLWPPRYFTWDRTNPIAAEDAVVFTDFELAKVTESPSKFKVALLLESREVAPKNYKSILKLEDQYDLILTFDKTLLKKGGKYRFYPFGGCWIPHEDCKLYPKTKQVSLIASAKKQTEGHKLRHKVVKRFGQSIDVCGRGYRPIPTKLEALAPYRYSIVIENVSHPGYFTEKIVDCFATGTIPIYWGCPGIENFFNPDGIIRFKNLRELGKILKVIGEEDYARRKEAIEDNLRRADDYRTPEDWIWKNILSKEAAFQ